MNRPAKPNVPMDAGDWLCFALSDLRYAELGCRRKGIVPGQVCFHAQQASEKALKALLLSDGIDFPLTHDLEELLRVARKGGLTFPPKVQRIVELTPYAVEARYPGSPDAITKRMFERPWDSPSDS